MLIIVVIDRGASKLYCVMITNWGFGLGQKGIRAVKGHYKWITLQSFYTVPMQPLSANYDCNFGKIK